jgi:uncharacterized protein (TIGR03118 family)
MSSSSQGFRTQRLLGLAVLICLAMLAALLAPTSSATASARPVASTSTTSDDDAGFTQVNLVSDVPGLAQLTDFRVSNPWGIAAGPTTPIWINNNNTATSEVYEADGVGPLARRLVVQTPAGPTGIAFNPTTAFAVKQPDGTMARSVFLFVSLDGYISGWVPPNTEATPARFNRRDGYAGMAVADTPAGPRMYTVSVQGRIKVFDGEFNRVPSINRFIDPTIGALQPYNVAVFDDLVYVAYADLEGGGPGGAISTFDLRGRFVRRVTSDPHLNAPWGMAIAPDDWGRFGNMLLVGNVGNGRISAFKLSTGAFRGQLRTAAGRLIVNNGLWGIQFGNGKTGTPRDLLFAAGIDDYTHGLFGLIHPN